MMYNIIILTHIVRFLGGYHMITAKEARERIDTLTTKRGEEEKRISEKRITKTVENGDGSCWLDIYISDATKKCLKSPEYPVKQRSNQRDGMNTEVKG